MSFNLNINGKIMVADVEPDMPLLWTLRDALGILGPKFGCGMGLCGACTVHLDGQPIRSCVTAVSSIGAAPVGARVQAAWTDLDVAQCGYCQPGQIMSAVALIKSKPIPSDEEIDSAMNGNICRCATYTRIRAAIKRASAQKGEA